MGKWDSYAEAPATTKKGKWDSYAETAAPTTPAAPAPKAEPGWFEPGSKSEALARGFSQGATLGFGDEIQALYRRLAPEALLGAEQGRTYAQLRDEERGANSASAQANPGSYLAGNVAAALPAGLAVTAVAPAKLAVGASLAKSLPGVRTGLVSIAKRGAALGAAQGLGTGEGDVADQALSTGVGATLGAVLPTAATAAARGVRQVAATTAGSNLTNSNAARVALTAEEQRRRDATAGAVIGGVGSKASGGGFLEGAGAGALAGYSGVLPSTRIMTATAPAVRAIADKGTRTAVGTANALTLALQNMSGQTSRRILEKADADIQAAVARGQPSYAATFQALNDPLVRTAQEKATDSADYEDPVPDDEDEVETD